jgi:hypothetical protein
VRREFLPECTKKLIFSFISICQTKNPRNASNDWEHHPHNYGSWLRGLLPKAGEFNN